MKLDWFNYSKVVDSDDIDCDYPLVCNGTPVVNFINVFWARFLYKIFGAKMSNPKASFVVFGAKILHERRAKNADEIDT